MTNRVVVVLVALVVGAGLYAGATAVEDVLTPDPGVAVDGEVVATNTTTHMDRVGRPTAVGEVINGLGEPIGDVSVTVTFDRDDGGADSATGQTLLRTIPASGRAPFAIRLEDRSARPAAVDVAVAYEEGADRPYDGLAVVDERETGRTDSQVTVAGRVENRGGERVAARVVATFYDENGSVVGVRSEPTSPRVLGAGDSGEFEVRFRTLGNVPSRADDVARYELALEAGPTDGSGG